MAFRSNESPMDFEYQNGTGPMDSRSPFAQISMNSQRQTNGNEGFAKKRGLYAAFGSPSKPAFPGLREPTSSQTYLFSSSSSTLPPSPSKQLPPTPFTNKNNPLFSTPRKLDVDLASSGGETPKSPGRADDTDATPDNSNYRSTVKKLDQMTIPSFTAGDKASSPKKEKRRDSWWSRAAGLVNSPGRGEVSRGVYSDKIVKRVSKRRKNKALERLRKDSVSDSEASDRPISPRKTSGTRRGADVAPEDKKGPHWMYTFFEFLSTHPTLPHILSWYAQLMLNIFLFSGLMWILWSFWATIKSDVDKKSSEAIAELMVEMAACAQQYTENKCARDTRVPAMETVCNNWEKCMNRDTKSVGRAKVSAHTFAEIFNSFMEPISYKTMIFSLLIFFGCIALFNLPFSMFRNRAEQAANHHHYYGNMPPPPTPQRHFSNPLDNAPYWTPHHNQQQAIEPAASGMANDMQGSPVRRLQFR